MAERWIVAVARDTCIGSGVCTGIAPGRFALREGLAEPAGDSSPDDRVTDAAQNCPVEAITVHEETSGRVLAPGEGAGP